MHTCEIEIRTYVGPPLARWGPSSSRDTAHSCRGDMEIRGRGGGHKSGIEVHTYVRRAGLQTCGKYQVLRMNADPPRGPFSSPRAARKALSAPPDPHLDAWQVQHQRSGSALPAPAPLAATTGCPPDRCRRCLGHGLHAAVDRVAIALEQ